ncbi:hypothetical protein EDS67_17560 [candidate division KSB1 bacterium]|nr:MAG: hypothetical protein EDS67_17560 [candidate division KSB1 bacterium]MBC6946445.1 hypothetical protein [candidate division KSB1 bacterium]MCE7942368.1 hypothetical protein [Chlorobi bacterium CHB1]
MTAISKKAHSKNKPRRETYGHAKSKKNGHHVTDHQLTELIEAYNKIGKLLEDFIGRERLYQPKFLRGLERARQDVSAGRTQRVKSFEDFVS